MVPKLLLLFTTEGWSAQANLGTFDPTKGLLPGPTHDVRISAQTQQEADHGRVLPLDGEVERRVREDHFGPLEKTTFVVEPDQES